ncbi:NAD-P-binding protein [Mycena floridula]|nr:NAD-P-binding protein [Mycena floridula]
MSAPENLQNTLKKQSFSEVLKWDVGRIPDLNGKVAIVSSTGIGFHIAHQLAVKGAKVYVSARDSTKVTEAIEEMRTLSLATNLNVHPLVMDLGTSKNKLDILVNSAALWCGVTLVKDQYGISQSFSIKNSEGEPRIVDVSSIAPLGVRFRSVEDSDFNQILGITDDYASKLNRYELDRHFRDEGINVLAISLHPGTAKTDSALTFVGKDVSVLNETLTPFKGALTPRFAAADPVIWEQRDH